MDAEYLKQSVGPALTMAMKSMIAEQPPDAVEYLGKYLLAHVEREEGKAATAQKFAAAAAVAQAKEQEERAAAEAAAKAAEPVLIAGEADLADALASSNEVEDLLTTFSEVVKTGTNATSVYVGTKDEEDGSGVPVITFGACSEGADMVGKSLRGVPPEADPEEAKPEGVTFNVFKQLEKPEGEEEAEAAEEGEEEDEAAASKGPEFPEQLVVPNVVRDGAVKFYGIPRLGSYLAVPVRYPGVLHADAVGEVTEEEVAAQAEAAEAKIADAVAAAEEAGEDVEAATAAAREKFAVPEGEVLVAGAKKPNAVSKEMVVGVHTMGQAGREFTDDELKFAKKWAGKLAAGFERAEMALWTAELQLLAAAAEADAESSEQIAAPKAGEEEKVVAKLEELGDAALDEVKDFEAKKIGFEIARDSILAVTARVVDLQQFRITPKPDFLRVLQCFMYSLDACPRDSFVEPATKKVQWNKLRKLIDGPLVEKLAAFDPAAEDVTFPKYASPDALKELLGDLSVDTAADAGLTPVYVALLDYTIKSIMVREAAEVKRAAEKEAAAAAAAEAEE